MPAEVMTYASLVEDIKSYSERSNDPEFIAQVPRFIMMAETQLAADWRGLGDQVWVEGAFTVNNGIIAKPDLWRETISWNYGVGEEESRVYILERSLEYCRMYWPVPSLALAARPPKYYANYDWDHFLVVPTPLLAFPFEIGYYARISTLSAEQQTNWLTEKAPQFLLAACLLQAQPFLKWFGERLQTWTAIYAQQAQSLGLEARNQTIDRSTVVDKQ